MPNFAENMRDAINNQYPVLGVTLVDEINPEGNDCLNDYGIPEGAGPGFVCHDEAGRPIVSLTVEAAEKYYARTNDFTGTVRHVADRLMPRFTYFCGRGNLEEVAGEQGVNIDPETSNLDGFEFAQALAYGIERYFDEDGVSFSAGAGSNGSASVSVVKDGEVVYSVPVAGLQDMYEGYPDDDDMDFGNIEDVLGELSGIIHDELGFC